MAMVKRKPKYTKAVAEKAKIVIKKPELEFKFKVKDRVEARFHGWKPCGTDMHQVLTMFSGEIVKAYARSGKKSYEIHFDDGTKDSRVMEEHIRLEGEGEGGGFSSPKRKRIKKGGRGVLGAISRR
ncbi:hypothetical protein TrCOL_g11081 [Triparma columacea]|uniref:Uncharacterized protein n=1 Tax=Triparma columacea TaxID=722753 RepID=A0A9W7GKS4_9STRA|nr:hypothetical protein TrCOL_g11081 [Triparma columacea]